MASIIGWSEDLVKRYSVLKAICKEAWNLIVTTFESNVTINTDDPVTKEVTTVTFTEGLLRNILTLNPTQQTELVKDLISGIKHPSFPEHSPCNSEACFSMVLSQMTEMYQYHFLS